MLAATARAPANKFFVPPSYAGPVADALNLNAGVALAAAQIAPDPATGTEGKSLKHALV
jgi:hypothetical protein